MEKVLEQMVICPSGLIPIVVLERRRKKFQTGPTPGTFRRLLEEICLSHQAFQISKIILHDWDEERMHFLGSIWLSESPKNRITSFFRYAKRTCGHPCWAKFQTALHMDLCNFWNSCQQITFASHEYPHFGRTEVTLILAYLPKGIEWMKAFSAEGEQIDFFLGKAHRVVVHQCISGMCLVSRDFYWFRNQVWEPLEGLKQRLIRPPRPAFLQIQGYFQIPQNSLDLFWASHNSFTLLCRISQLSTNAVGIGNNGSWAVISVLPEHIGTITNTSGLRQPLTTDHLQEPRKWTGKVHYNVRQLWPLFLYH